MGQEQVVDRSAPQFTTPAGYKETNSWRPTIDITTYELKRDEVDKEIARVIKALVELEDKAGIFLYKLDDGRIIDSCKWNFWEWPQAIGLNGLLAYYEVSRDSNPAVAAHTLDIIKAWYAARDAEGGTTKNVNTMSVMFTLASLVDLDARDHALLSDTERKTYNEWLDDWAEWAMTGCPRTEGGGFQHLTYRKVNWNQLWDDTLMMTVIPLARIGVLRGRQDYIEEAKFQFAFHAQYLLDPESGLWTHAWAFDGKGSGHKFADALWARGNCWITLAIPMFLELVKLSPTDPVYRTLVHVFQRQVDALVPLQDQKTGLWHTLLLEPTSYIETSASSGFAGGILMGIRLGLLAPEKYLPCALLGLKGSIAQIQPNGEVANVSGGTPTGPALDFYRHIPRRAMGYGQSLLIVAIGEWMKLQGV